MTTDEMDKATQTKDKFEVFVNVKEFRPDEITVKTIDEMVIVEGKQEKRGGNVIPRHFIKRFKLPEYFDSEDVESIISDDGILEVKAFPASQKKFRHLEELKAQDNVNPK